MSTRTVCAEHVYLNRNARRCCAGPDCYICTLDALVLPQRSGALDAAHEVRDRTSEAHRAVREMVEPLAALREMLDALTAASEMDDAEALDAFHAVMVDSNNHERLLDRLESLQDDVDTYIGADLDTYSDRTLDYLRDIA